MVATIYDFNYDSFNMDILSKFIDFDGTLSLRKQNPNQPHTAKPPTKQPAENNIQMLIESAYTDSSSTMPVMFLISHSVNVQTEL